MQTRDKLYDRTPCNLQFRSTATPIRIVLGRFAHSNSATLRVCKPTDRARAKSATARAPAKTEPVCQGLDSWIGRLVADNHNAPLQVQFTVQSAIVEMSLTKMRLPETAGAGQVALSATV